MKTEYRIFNEQNFENVYETKVITLINTGVFYVNIIFCIFTTFVGYNFKWSAVSFNRGVGEVNILTARQICNDMRSKGIEKDQFKCLVNISIKMDQYVNF